MPTTEEYINSLKNDKDALVIALHEKGVEADFEEPFTSLVSKVSDITPKLQEKRVSPDEEIEVEVEPGVGYDGLSKVVVEPIPDWYVVPFGDMMITNNGYYDVKTLEYVEVAVGGNIEQGVIVKSQTYDGFANEVEIVGMTKIPSYYMQSESTTAPSFWGKMTKLKIPNYVTEIGQYAFSFDQYYELLNGELPDSITTVGQYGFYYNKNLKITKLPSSLTTTGTSSFSNCINMTIDELPSSLKTIGNSCFHSCPNVKIKEIPSAVTTLGTASFYNGTGITGDLVVNASITAIETNVFNGCSNMTSCEFTQTKLTKIDAYSFSKCSKLAKLIIHSTTLPSLPNSNAFNSTPIASGTGYIYFQDDLVASAKTATNWSKYASQIRPLSELEG